MKKILILILALVITLGLASCGGECEHVDANTDGKCDNCGENVGECPHEDTDSNGKCDKCGTDLGQATGGDLVLVADEKTEFAVVTALNLSDKAKGYVSDFVKELNNYYLADGKLKMNYDAPGFDDATEIIFGPASNRGDAFKKDEHYLGYKGFSVEVVGNKLFVLAGGDKGYQYAIEYLEETLFNLESYGNDPIDELIVSADTKYEDIPTNYDIEEIKIDGNSASEYVISYTGSSSSAKSSALILQETIYKQSGIWLPYVSMNKITDDQKVVYVEFTKDDAERTTDNGCIVYVEDGDLHIECEFENKFEEIMYSFINSKLSSSKVKFSSTYTYSKDIRNIYYRDYGAKGDGQTDDFFALKACHDYANEWGHTVNADSNATYYIGKENGTQSITVKTDTYWNCCTFIWDDSVIDKPDQSEAYLASIFDVAPDKSSYTLSGSKLPVSSLPSGSTTVGDWKPGEKVLVTIYDNSQRHYIRFGANENNGTAQTEIIIVNADGTIDPDTPVQWDYSNLSKMVVYPCNDKPITISGGTKDQVDNYDALGTFDNLHCIDRTKIITYFNTAPSEYKYHARNINITRSNVTIKNLEHVLYDDVETSAPYTGFIKIYTCADVTVEGMIFQKQKGFSTSGASGDDVGMGSYEISANNAHRITWRHCRQSNFFNDNGSVTYKGYMGTNYCKNLTFDDMVSCSFDAHCGLYNGTIKNSTIEHLNFVGGGTAYYENVTVYTDGCSAAIIHRTDYGSIWDGNIIMNGITLRTSKSNPKLSIVKAEYTNHYFGYECCLAERIEVSNAKIVYYGYEVKNGERTEWDIATNHVPLHLYSLLESYSTVDISDPDADMTSKPNDYTECKCEQIYKEAYPNDPTKHKTFKDTNSDGRCENDRDPTDNYSRWCWGFRKCECDSFNDADGNYFCDDCLGFEETVPTHVNANPYAPTKELYISDCGDLEIIIPDTPQFEDLKFYLDGVLQEED